MPETPHLNRRRFFSIAAATVAAGSLGLPLLYRRVNAMTETQTEVGS
jgi:hypothetical protein